MQYLKTGCGILALAVFSCGGSGSGPKLSFLNEGSTGYTNGPFVLRLAVEGADAVELHVDGKPIAELKSPFEYAWDTASYAEGAHAVRARAVSGGDSSEASYTVVVDRTPPAIVARAPSSGGALRASDPQVTFSEAILPASITDAAVALTTEGGEAIPKMLSVSSDGKTVLITPTSPIALPAKVKVAVADSFVDLAGNQVISPLDSDWSFSILPLETALTADNAYGNESFNLHVRTEGEVVNSIQLLLNGALVTTLQPPYDYRLAVTDGMADGDYEAVAYVVKGAYSFRSAPLKLTVDRARPTMDVDSIFPKPDSTYVVLGSGIRVRFSEPLSKERLTGASVTLTSTLLSNGGGSIDVKKQLRLSGDGRVLRIYPGEIPHLGTSHTPNPVATLSVTLNPEGITDRAGNPAIIGKPQWNVQIRAWEPVGNPYNDPAAANPTYGTEFAGITDPAWQTLDVQVVLDQAQLPMMGYLKGRGVNVPALEVARFDGQRWRPSTDKRQSLVRSDGSGIPHFGLVEHQGEVSVAWVEDNQIVVRRAAGDDLEWLPASAGPPAIPVSGGQQPVLKMDPSGSLVVAFFADSNGLRHLHIYRYIQSQWRALPKALPVEANASELRLELNQAGAPLVSWIGGESARRGGRAVRWVGSWSDGHWEMTATAPAPVESIVMAQDGQVYVASVHSRVNEDPDVQYIFVSKWANGSWQDVGESLSQEVGRNPMEPKLNVSSSGYPIVAWVQGRPAYEATDAYVASFDGSRWNITGDKLSASAAYGSYVNYFKFILDMTDRPVLAWAEYNPNLRQAFVFRPNR